MNRNQAKQLVANMPFIKAFAEGRKVRCGNAELDDQYDPNFLSSPDAYSIVPEPEYRPYRSGEVTVGAVVIRKNNPGWRRLITAADADMVWMGSSGTGGVSLHSLFQEYTYLDGTPCGVKQS
jgi:hypothetical protein